MIDVNLSVQRFALELARKEARIRQLEEVVKMAIDLPPHQDYWYAARLRDAAALAMKP